MWNLKQRFYISKRDFSKPEFSKQEFSKWELSKEEFQLPLGYLFPFNEIWSLWCNISMQENCSKIACSHNSSNLRMHRWKNDNSNIAEVEVSRNDFSVSLGEPSIYQELRKFSRWYMEKGKTSVEMHQFNHSLLGMDLTLSMML